MGGRDKSEVKEPFFILAYATVTVNQGKKKNTWLGEDTRNWKEFCKENIVLSRKKYSLGEKYF